MVLQRRIRRSLVICLVVDERSDLRIDERRQSQADLRERLVLALQAPDQAQPGEMPVRVVRPRPNTDRRRQETLRDVVANRARRAACQAGKVPDRIARTISWHADIMTVTRRTVKSCTSGAGGVGSRRGERHRGSGSRPGGAAQVERPRTTSSSLASIVGAKGSRTWIDLTSPVAGARRRRRPARSGCTRSSPRTSSRATSGRRSSSSATSSTSSRSCSSGTASVHSHEIDFVLGRGFLLSAHPASWDPMTAHQLRLGVGPLLERGPDFVLWALVDAIVDSYFPVFDRLGDEIDDVQDAAFERPVPATLERLFGLKRELITDPARRGAQPGGVRPADEPRVRADRGGQRLLLPRRVRPPDPAQRRARLVPGAGRRARSRSTCRRSTTTCRRS